MAPDGQGTGALISGRPKWWIPWQLAGMMFLQYFGLGAWVVPLTRYLQAPVSEGGLGFVPLQVAWIYSTFAFGAFVAPVLVGPLADRWFAVERVIAATHALMALLMALAAWACHSPLTGPQETFALLFVSLLGYAIGCQITLTLTNVISFRNLDDRIGAFWYVRLTGTFGWIVSGWVIGWLLEPVSVQPLVIAALASAFLAVFAPTLPHTPPKGYGRPIREVLGLPAVRLLTQRSFLVFAVVLFVGGAMNQFYTVFTSRYLADLGVQVPSGPLGRLTPELIMTLAQWCEMACMATTPWLLRQMGLKSVMVLGLLGWVLRNAALYSGWPSLIVAIALPMHGWSYAFYTLVGMHYVDRAAPPHLRAGAQALVTFLAHGPAILCGNLLAGWIVALHRQDSWTDWPAVWRWPLVAYLTILLLFAILFRPERDHKVTATASGSTP
ncbi:MAG: MFS transporter [Gemmataceae bacterium]|nr:MFS transporter [Gemmataceae bacterium]